MGIEITDGVDPFYCLLRARGIRLDLERRMARGWDDVEWNAGVNLKVIVSDEKSTDAHDSFELMSTDR